MAGLLSAGKVIAAAITPLNWSVRRREYELVMFSLLYSVWLGRDFERICLLKTADRNQFI